MKNSFWLRSSMKFSNFSMHKVAYGSKIVNNINKKSNINQTKITKLVKKLILVP